MHISQSTLFIATLTRLKPPHPRCQRMAILYEPSDGQLRSSPSCEECEQNKPFSEAFDTAFQVFFPWNLFQTKRASIWRCSRVCAVRKFAGVERRSVHHVLRKRGFYRLLKMLTFQQLWNQKITKNSVRRPLKTAMALE